MAQSRDMGPGYWSPQVDEQIRYRWRQMTREKTKILDY